MAVFADIDNIFTQVSVWWNDQIRRRWNPFENRPARSNFDPWQGQK